MRLLPWRLTRAMRQVRLPPLPGWPANAGDPACVLYRGGWLGSAFESRQVPRPTRHIRVQIASPAAGESSEPATDFAQRWKLQSANLLGAPRLDRRSRRDRER